MHKIQKQILIKLAHNKNLRYSQLRIDDVENDLFNYHLQYLVKEAYIDKNESEYNLSEKGIGSVLLMDAKGREYEGFRLSVLLYVINESAEKKLVLSQHRIREPYIDEITPGIAGKIKQGELIEDAARRKLLEKSGLTADIRFVGSLRRIVHHQGGLIDDGIWHVFVCTNPKGKLITENEFGINSWVSVEEAIQQQQNLKKDAPKSMQIVKNVMNENYDLFYVEEEIVL